ncbi:hypothetical protein PVAP13_6NG192312 [Panicum virgatum]|uniref:Uncharacterized protein n=1 Tax=Panicum virgatum TaxID=38727 RepID=A0A8T0QWI1_PANVG|nr:hypothetical protein PVAP13_6NG192312 [Panicum virgatum]
MAAAAYPHSRAIQGRPCTAGSRGKPLRRRLPYHPDEDIRPHELRRGSSELPHSRSSPSGPPWCLVRVSSRSDFGSAPDHPTVVAPSPIHGPQPRAAPPCRHRSLPQMPPHPPILVLHHPPDVRPTSCCAAVCERWYVSSPASPRVLEID